MWRFSVKLGLVLLLCQEVNAVLAPFYTSQWLQTWTPECDGPALQRAMLLKPVPWARLHRCPLPTCWHEPTQNKTCTYSSEMRLPLWRKGCEQPALTISFLITTSVFYYCKILLQGCNCVGNTRNCFAHVITMWPLMQCWGQWGRFSSQQKTEKCEWSNLIPSGRWCSTPLFS